MLRRLLRLLIVILPLASLLLCISPELAAGVGVAPSKIEFKVRPGGVETQTLQVFNQSDENSQFQVYVEGEHKEWFKITTGEFTLSPQETRSVEIVLAPPFTATSEEHDFSICVVSVPLGYNLNIGAGIKVKTQVQVTKFPVMAIQWWIASAVILIIGVAVGIFIRWRRHARYV